MTTESSKTCTKCKQTKTLTEYYLNAKAKDRKQSRCIVCNKADSTERQKTVRAEDRWSNSISSGYGRAKRAGLPHDKFTSEELVAYWESRGISPDHSIYTGEPLGPIEGSDHVLEHVFPMDEKEPDGPGHVLSNLVPANRSDNKIKGRKGLIEAITDINRARGPIEPPEEYIGAYVTSWEQDEDK